MPDLASIEKTRIILLSIAFQASNSRMFLLTCMLLTFLFFYVCSKEMTASKICPVIASLSWDSQLNIIFIFMLQIGRLRSRPKRQIILRYIYDNPGCMVSDIILKCNIPRGTTRYHIQRLEKEGKIIMRKAGKYLRIFPESPAVNEKEKSLLLFVRNKNFQKILCTMIKKDGITNSELSNKHNMDKSLTYRYLKQLLTNHIISSKREGKNKRYYVERKIVPVLTGLLTNHPV